MYHLKKMHLSVGKSPRLEIPSILLLFPFAAHTFLNVSAEQAIGCCVYVLSLPISLGVL